MDRRQDEKEDTTRGEAATKTKKSWKKPLGMPKRPLSAYNLFFAEERQRLLESNGSKRPRLGFSGLARKVAAKWKELDEASKAPYVATAEKEKERYNREVAEWQKLGLDPRPPSSRRRKRTQISDENEDDENEEEDEWKSQEGGDVGDDASLEQESVHAQPDEECEQKDDSPLARFIRMHSATSIGAAATSNVELLSLALRSSTQVSRPYDPSNSTDQCMLWSNALVREIAVKRPRHNMLTNPDRIGELAGSLGREEVDFIVHGFGPKEKPSSPQTTSV